MRLIDATTLKAEFTGDFQELWHYTGIWAMIDVAPTIEAVQVVHGSWVEIDHGTAFKCSNCGYLTDYHLTKFCPECGAKLDGKKV